MTKRLDGRLLEKGESMKNRLLPALLILLITSSSLVLADAERWHSHGYSEARISTHEGWGHHGSYHHYRGDWGWSPLAAAAVIGSTFYIANNLSSPPPATVIVSPPVVQYIPVRVAYFCPASQQYYPVAPTCPMPWQMVNY